MCWDITENRGVNNNRNNGEEGGYTIYLSARAVEWQL